MVGDTELALLIRVGCPRQLDFRNSARPFWGVLEYLAKSLLDEERRLAYLHLSAMQHLCAQGYPGLGVSADFVVKLSKDACDSVRAYGRAALPWYKWPTEAEEKQYEEDALREEAQELIAAWKETFEPENGMAKAPR